MYYFKTVNNILSNALVRTITIELASNWSGVAKKSVVALKQMQINADNAFGSSRGYSEWFNIGKGEKAVAGLRFGSSSGKATVSVNRASVYTTRRSFSSVGVKPTANSRKKMVKLTEQERSEQLQPLINAGWSVVNDRDAIYKQYIFSDFNQAFSFMAGTALLAEKLNHHPEWFNVYNKVQVTLSTHDVDGLSAKDIRMANYMEVQSKSFL